MPVTFQQDEHGLTLGNICSIMGAVTYEVVRDLAAFAGVITGAVIAFATWDTLRAERRPLQLFALHTGAGETVYVVPFSVENRTPSDRQIHDAWLDLAPPASPPRRPGRLFNILMRPLQRVAARKPARIRALAVRHAVGEVGRDWVRPASLDVGNPVYVPFKVGGFDTQKGTLFFPIFPWDKELLNEHGLPATPDFLKMLGIQVERAFIAQFGVKDDRGKTRAVFVVVVPPPQVPS